MLKAKLYSQRINSWEVLVSSLEGQLDNFEWMRPMYEELVELLGKVRVIVVEQEAARAEFHHKVTKRLELERQGVELTSRIGAHLKAHLGFRNDQLRQFGINPLPRVFRRKTDPDIETPEVVTPAENEVKED